jgi:hypothetical protein
MTQIEITGDGSRNENLYFRPLQRPLRGTFDFGRVPEPLAHMKRAEFPRPIPGLRIMVDAEKRTATITDPLHEPAHAAIREKIQAMGLMLGPAAETFDNIDANTWLFWMRRAVANGVGKIVEGKFPEIDEAKARKNFITAEQRDPRDGLIDRLVAVLYASLPADRRKEVAALVGG